VKKYNDISVFGVVEELEFLKLAKRPDLDLLIYNSIAPTIYGHPEVKMALTFALFGGNEKID
jgi:DNA replicative helicase MCM subunit Mcm2 (Cdc46/Mcm family)